MKLLTANEVAQKWNCSIKTVYKNKDKGFHGVFLKFKKIGGMVRFPDWAVESFESECRNLGGAK